MPGSYAGRVKQLKNTRKILFGRKGRKVHYERHISTKDKYIITYFVDIRCDVINWIQLARDTGGCFEDAVQSMALIYGVSP